MSGRITRRALVASAAASAFVAAGARGQSAYPDRPVIMIVPAPLGSGPDILARVYAQRLSEVLGQQVLVDTVPGASGLIGTQKALKARADGHTIIFGFNQLVSVNPNTIPNLSYDVERDMSPVAKIADGAYIWIANNNFPANNVREWIALAKARPGSVKFGTTGPGSVANLAGELFMERTGTQMMAVSYKGNHTPDLLSGIIDMKLEPYATGIPLIKASRVKALAITGANRLADLPDVPTMTEFLPDYVVPGWYSIWVPAGTPEAVVKRLNTEFNAITRSPNMVERFQSLSLQPSASTPEELRIAAARERAMWAELVAKRGMKFDA